MMLHSAFGTLLAAAPRYGGALGRTRLGPVQQALQDLFKKASQYRLAHYPNVQLKNRFPSGPGPLYPIHGPQQPKIRSAPP